MGGVASLCTMMRIRNSDGNSMTIPVGWHKYKTESVKIVLAGVSRNISRDRVREQSSLGLEV